MFQHYFCYEMSFNFKHFDQILNRFELFGCQLWKSYLQTSTKT